MKSDASRIYVARANRPSKDLLSFEMACVYYPNFHVKFLIHLLLWVGWGLMALFVVASIMMLRPGAVEAIEEPPDKAIRLALPIISVLGALVSTAAIHLRKHLFWIRRKVTIDDSGGRAIFLGFTMAGLTGAGLSALTLLASKFLWDATILPLLGVASSMFFLVLLFPRLPSAEP